MVTAFHNRGKNSVITGVSNRKLVFGLHGSSDLGTISERLNMISTGRERAILGRGNSTQKARKKTWKNLVRLGP